MNRANNKNKAMAFTVAGLIVFTGIYNTVVINSQSHISSDVKLVKRLDEIYGVTVKGREIAATTTWKKLGQEKVVAQKQVQNFQTTVKSEAAPVFEQAESAIAQEELSLSLVEVINPNKYANGLNNNQFNGSLSTNNGVIESLSVSLPNGEGVTASFTEMSGNVFQYDLNGEVYSCMMYQVDQFSYMVTLTNGPLEGTRLRFSTEQPATQQQMVQETLAENNVDVGSFGSQPVNPEALTQDTQGLQQETSQAQGFNFGETQSM